MERKKEGWAHCIFIMELLFNFFFYFFYFYIMLIGLIDRID